jgi:transposase
MELQKVKITSWVELVKCQAIGIDVSKKHLDIAGICGTIMFHGKFENTSEAIGEFVETLSRHCFPGTILCESTGHYHLVLAVMACEAGLDIRVVNPLMSSKHFKSAIRKTQTDRIAAYILAGMVLTEPNLPPRLRLTRHYCQVRHTIGLIQTLEKHLQGLRRSLSSYRERVGQLEMEAVKGFQEMVEGVNHLLKSHEQLVSGLSSIILEAKVSDHASTVARVQAVPGVTAVNASLFTFIFDPKASSAKSWIAYSGLDVAVKESGTWRGHGKLTKRGPAWLRKRLFQSAWGAALNYPYVRRYYDALKEKGRKHKEAVIIIAKKLLNILYVLIVREEDFDPMKAFQLNA